MKKLTLQQFRENYPDDNACLDKLFQLRYGNIKICPVCNKETAFKRVKDRRSYQCIKCGKYQVYPTKGTIFEKTTIPLTFWFHAMYLQTTTRNGVSAKELERTFDICYKTALRMAHQIKILFGSKGATQLSNITEADETYIGGLEKNKHKKDRLEGTGSINKVGVFAMLERDGKIITKTVGHAPNGEVLKPIIRKHIDKEATLITDGFGGYKDLDKEFKQHEIINHNQGEYGRGIYHTNTIEGFFSQLKRTIKGTHIHVSKKHLQKYVDEVAFRYMNKDRQDVMFDIALNKVAQ